MCATTTFRPCRCAAWMMAVEMAMGIFGSLPASSSTQIFTKVWMVRGQLVDCLRGVPGRGGLERDAFHAGDRSGISVLARKAASGGEDSGGVRTVVPVADRGWGRSAAGRFRA